MTDFFPDEYNPTGFNKPAVKGYTYAVVNGYGGPHAKSLLSFQSALNTIGSNGQFIVCEQTRQHLYEWVDGRWKKTQVLNEQVLRG